MIYRTVVMTQFKLSNKNNQLVLLLNDGWEIITATPISNSVSTSSRCSRSISEYGEIAYVLKHNGDK